MCKVCAKNNIEATSWGDKIYHSWTAGRDYELTEGSGYFVLTSDNGQVNFVPSAKDSVLCNFTVK